LSSTAGARAQPARNARKLGSRSVASQPGSVANCVGVYSARSGAGFGGGQTGQGTWAQPAISRITASQFNRAMWVVYLEMFAALVVAALIVWFTWPRKPK
jgi:hypothetical protein